MLVLIAAEQQKVEKLKEDMDRDDAIEWNYPRLWHWV